jgi:hypothetical protein
MKALGQILTMMLALNKVAFSLRPFDLVSQYVSQKVTICAHFRLDRLTNSKQKYKAHVDEP